MRKKVFIILLIILIILLFLLFLFMKDKYYKKDALNNKKEVVSTISKEKLIDNITSSINDDTSSGDDNSSDDKELDEDKGYDQYVVASGYSGSSDNVYYIKNNVLYHLSISTNKIVKIAEGVLKLESGKGEVLVYKGEKFKLLENDDYLTFVD